MSTKSDKAIEQFIDRLGLIFQTEGLPRIAGRIMGLLVIHGGPISFSALSDKLQVSRGSISSNTRLLENIRIIERVTRSGERQDYFQMRTKPYVELLKGSKDRMIKAQEVVAEAEHELPEEWSETQSRLKELKYFYRDLIKLFDDMLMAKVGSE